MAITSYLLLVCLAVAVVNGAPAEDDLDTKVINGRLALNAEFPFIVSLQWLEGGSVGRWCGGSILSATWVLTAAHCVDSATHGEGNFYVRAGVTNSWDTGNPNGQFVQVKRAINHPGYHDIRSTNPHDIALLELKTPLKFNKYVQPIPLPKADYVPKGMSTIIGWGEAGNITHHYSPDDLLAVTTPIYPIEDCFKLFETVRLTVNKHVCPGKYGEGSCQGDSGGPLIQDINGQRTLIGVCSFTGVPCAVHPGVYMNVGSYINDFINPTMSGKA